MEYLDQLKKIVCDVCGISEDAISQKCKRKELVLARTLFVNYAVKLTPDSRAIVKTVNLSLDDIRPSIARYQTELESNILFKFMDDTIRKQLCSE